MSKLHYFILLFIISLKISAQSDFSEFINYEKLSDKVLLVRAGTIYPDQVVAVLTEKGVVLFDSGISPTLSKEYRKIIEKEFGIDNFTYVINTHHHFDHTNGNQVFDEAAIVAHENSAKRMKEFGKSISDFVKARKERYQRRERLLNTLDPQTPLAARLRDLTFTSRMMCNDLQRSFKLTLPTLTFSKKLTIDLGDLNVHLLYFGDGYHTDNDIIAFIPEEGMVFTGDLLLRYETNANITSAGNFSAWISALDEVLNSGFAIKHIVTIHAGILKPQRLLSFHNKFVSMHKEKMRKQSAIPLLQTIISNFGINEGIPKFVEKLDQSKEQYYLWEGDLLELAYGYLTKKDNDIAVRLFELCTELFPNSVDSFDWLGNTYASLKMDSKAIKIFRKCLELNPMDSFAADMIYQIENRNND